MAPTWTWLTDDFRDHVFKLFELGTPDGDTVSAMTYVPIKTNGLTITPEVLELITQGTTQKYKTGYVDTMDLAIANNVLPEALTQLFLHNGTAVSPETRRGFFDGDFSAFPLLTARITTTANRISDGALRYIRYIFPKCNVKSGSEVDGFQVIPATLAGTVVLTAQKTSTDPLGASITFPSGVTEAFYYRTIGPS